jgi:cellobiose phosphorylase
MRFGYFDNPSKEYVITQPNTPLPWINYLGCDEYCALISNTGGGYSFLTDPRDQRILRYRYDNVPFDRGGRYLYVRDDDTGQFFSPTWQPTNQEIRNPKFEIRNKFQSRNSKSQTHFNYECRHGLGYTVISSEYDGIGSKITYFVPLGENLEVWKMEIRSLDRARDKNKKSEIRNCSLFSFVEFCLWDAVGDSTNFQRTWSIGKAHCEGNSIYHTTLYNSWMDIFAYFSTSEKIHSFDCQRRDFLGNYGYNSLDAPLAVVRGNCSNSVAIGWAPVGAHCVKLKLKPGEKKTVVFVLGVSDKLQTSNPKLQNLSRAKSRDKSQQLTAKTKKEVQNKIKKFQDPKVVEKELKKLKDYWEENLSKLQIETPEGDMNTSINIWNSYQCMQTFNWSRYASYYEAGIGRGMGFRDSCQDTLGFAHMIPDKVRARILELASVQFEDGSTHHQYSPITKKGALYNYSDDQLWLILATANYIKETGDFSILDEEVVFAKRQEFVAAPMGHYNKSEILNSKYETNSKSQMPKASLYEHLRRAVDYTWKHRGKHGLPLSLFSDWNDCLNLDGGAESVFVACLFVEACREMGKMLHAAGRKLQASSCMLHEKGKYQSLAKKMTKIVNAKAWDGKWYKRAYNGDGKPVGSKKCKEGKIFLEPQPWAVISGVANGKRAKQTLDSVFVKLFTKYGIKLLSPAFQKYYPEYGEISTYPPGLKENASIFCHPNPWAMVAECVLGRGDRAFEYYKAILPVSQNNQAHIRKTEPYAYCQMVAGPDHPDFGEGKNSWLTGSAAWNYVAATQFILGIKPDYEGLVIDPCVPKKWKNFTVKRFFRNDTYIIKVHNPKGKSKGVKFIKVDGRRIDSKVIAPFGDGKQHIIEVVL